MTVSTLSSPPRRFVLPGAMLASLLLLPVASSGLNLHGALSPRRASAGLSPRRASGGSGATLCEGAVREARVDVLDAGAKGMGAFAAEALAQGTWVGAYRGTLCTHKETKERYGWLPEAEYQQARAYVFELDAEYVIDARNETHFTRYFNHAEFGSLDVEVDADAQRVDFYAARSIGRGEELTFDYGYPYWRRSPPSPETDGRNFSAPFYQVDPPQLTLLHPPPIGSVLPLTPMSAQELHAALLLPPSQSLAALVRSLDFFGAYVRGADGTVEVSVGLQPDAERVRVPWGGELAHDDAQRAAVRCIVEASVETQCKVTSLGDDGSGSEDDDDAFRPGEALRELTEWLEAAAPELGVIRQWRSRTPRFASPQHDAAALAAYLIWKNPNAHQVTTPLPRSVCNALIAQAAAATASGEEGAQPADHLIRELSKYAAETHVAGLVATLARCIEVGDGCVVVSHRPPALTGALTPHIIRVWGRVPLLVESGHLRYDE